MILSSPLLNPHSCRLQASPTCWCKRFYLTFPLKLLGSATKTVVLTAAILCWPLFGGIMCSELSWNTHSCLACSTSAPRLGVTSYSGWLQALSRVTGVGGVGGRLEIRRSKGQGEDSLLSPPRCQLLELLHRFCCSLSRKALVLIKYVVTACMSKQRLDTRWKESDQKKKGGCVGGSYLVSPAELRICTSLCPQNIILISLSSRQFLKQESRKQWRILHEKIGLDLIQEKKGSPVWCPASWVL